MTSYVEEVDWIGLGSPGSPDIELGISVDWIGQGDVSIDPVLLSVNVEFAGAGSFDSPAVIGQYHAEVDFVGLGSPKGPIDMTFADINAFKVTNWTVNKSYNDCMWKLTAPVADLNLPDFYKMFRVLVKDWKEIEHCVFIGMVPDSEKSLIVAKKTSKIIGWDFGFYLSNQEVPKTMWTPDIETNPANLVTELLGGTDWIEITGIEPYQMMTVSDWGTKGKQFKWKAGTSKWNAIQDMLNYCKYVFTVKWRQNAAGNWTPAAYFVPEDILTLDTNLDNPVMAIIEKGV